MATSAGILVKDEEKCGYCLRQLPYMEDPILLPCSHLFCLPCLPKDMKQSCSLKCVICSRLHSGIKLNTLPKVLITPESDEHNQRSRTAPCDVCEGQKCPSVCYCAQCMKNICEQHFKAHEIFLGSTHPVVFNKPDEASLVKCHSHVKENVTQACSLCHQMFCNSCNTDLSCTAGADAKHEIVRIEQQAKALRSGVNEVLKSLSGKITKLCMQERAAWNDADEIKERVQQLKKEVDKVAAQQIAQVEKKAQCLKTELTSYLKTMVTATESYTAKLTSRAECMQRIWKSTRRLSMASSVGVVKSHEQISSKETRELLDWSIPQAEHTTKDLIYSPPLPDNLFSIRRLTTFQSKSPSLLKSVGAISLSSASAMLINEDKIITSCFTDNSPTCTYNTDLEVTQWVTDNRVIVALATLPREKFGQFRYLAIIEEDNSRKQGGKSARLSLEMVTEDFAKRKQVDRYPNSTYNDRRFGVAVHPLTHQIISVNAQTKYAVVYDSNGDFQMNVEISGGVKSNPTDIRILPDGGIVLFFESFSTLGKFELNPDTKTLQKIWLETNLPSLAGISYDDNGYIYASSKLASCVYVISPTGNTLSTLHHQKLKDTGISIMDISGSYLAIVSQSELHLMELV